MAERVVQYQTTEVISKGQLLRWWLKQLSPEDQENIRADATVLVGEIWQRNRIKEHPAHFGPVMALELLYELGRCLNELE